MMSRLLLVGFLFISVSCSILDIGRARAKPIQVTTVLCIINMILEEHLGNKINNTQPAENTHKWFYEYPLKRELKCSGQSKAFHGPDELTSLILKKAMPVSKESEPAWCCGPILSSSSCSATSCNPPWKQSNARDSD